MSVGAFCPAVFCVEESEGQVCPPTPPGMRLDPHGWECVMGSQARRGRLVWGVSEAKASAHPCFPMLPGWSPPPASTPCACTVCAL